MRRNLHFIGEQTDDGFIGHDRDEVRQALLDLEAAVYQLGGRISMSAIRQQIGDDAYVTTGVVIAYDSFSPALREQLPDEEELPPEDVRDGAPDPV